MLACVGKLNPGGGLGAEVIRDAMAFEERMANDRLGREGYGQFREVLNGLRNMY